MATNRDLLKEAIADAKAVKETAIANAKAALEEAFTPYLKEKLSAKLNEMDEGTYEEAETTDEMMTAEEDTTNEEISLDELLAELDSENEGLYEAEEEEAGEEEEGEEEEMNIEDMSEDDLKHFIEDVIKDMVSAGELEAGHEGEGEEEAGEEEFGGEEEMGGEELELDEEFDINELLAELEEGSLTKGERTTDTSSQSWFEKGKKQSGEGPKEVTEDNLEESMFDMFQQLMQDLGGSDQYISKLSGAIAGTGVALSTILLALKDETFRKELMAALKEDAGKLKDFIVSKFKGNKSSTSEKSEMEEQLDELRNELNEVNLLNAKLLYTNKIFRNKSLNESQKVKVLTAFDKATTKKEVELVYETLIESLKVSTTKAPIKESMGSASKVLGGVTSKPIIENDAFARMRELAFGRNK